MDKQTKEEYNKLKIKLAENHKEIIDVFNTWYEKKIDSETHDRISTTLFEEKRKILADISMLTDDNHYERTKSSIF
jgi:hypothetical protein